MKRFGWIAALLSVALFVSGCSSEEPQEPVDQSSEIDIEIEMPGDAPSADIEQPADEKPAEMEPQAAEPAAPAKVEPAAAEAKPDKTSIHKAVGNALKKALVN